MKKEKVRKRDSETAPQAAPANRSGDLITLGGPRPAQGDEIRQIAGRIVDQQVRSGHRGLAICGVDRGAGVSFMAANVAVCMAQLGINTLLIDGNLRDPSLDQIMAGDRRAEAGLRQTLATNAAHPGDLVTFDILPNLSVLHAGIGADDAEALLGHDRFRDVIESCLRDFEFTIIDTPPAAESSDALRIAAVVGYGLIVARRDATHIDDVSTLVSQLQQDGVKVVGVVLNGA